MKEELDQIKEVVQHTSNSPVLLLERASQLFREHYHKEIINLEDDNDLEDFILNGIPLNNDKVLVIGIGVLVKKFSLLYSLLEQGVFPIIVLCPYDSGRITSTFLSRFTTVLKMSYATEHCANLKAVDGMTVYKDELKEKMLSGITEQEKKKIEERVFANHSPEYYYYKNKSSRYVCGDKIIEMLSGGLYR